MAIGKCPKCDKTLGNLTIDAVTGSAGLGSTSWNCINLLCPWCKTILSSQIDPIAIRTDILNAIKGK